MKNPFRSINWRYATGEIIIVIIGITIAFSLSRWNEQSILRQKKEQYTASLLEDLRMEKKHLEENVRRFEEKINRASSIRPVLYGRKEGRDSAMFEFFRLAELINYNPDRVTYDVMVNTGDIGLITDLSIQKQLARHYANQEIIRQSYDRLANINQKYFADLMIFDIDYRLIQQGDYSIFDKPYITNLVESLIASYNLAIESTVQGIGECEKLEKELVNSIK